MIEALGPLSAVARLDQKNRAISDRAYRKAGSVRSVVLERDTDIPVLKFI